MPTDFDAHFHGFLDSTVNLKQYRLDQLDSRVTAITNAFIKDAEMGKRYKEHLPQGSWAHETIINPVSEYDEFDADILLHLEANPDWNDNPKIYLQQVRAAFKRSSTYKDKLVRKNRCVRISYANDCHVDVVPAVTLDDGRQVIICYHDNTFEETNPVGFADWMKERDDITGGQLRRIIRLLKWLRDFKNTFSCPSVVLTVMLGGRVQFWDTQTTYSDIPTALVHLLEALDTWLASYPESPPLNDPSCPGVSFSHRWDDPATIANFKRKIADYARSAREAYDLQGDDDAAALQAWQKLFGPEFAADEVKAARDHIVAAKVIRDLSARTIVLGTTEIVPGEDFIENRYPVGPLLYTATIEARIRGALRQPLLRQQRVVGRAQRLRFHVRTDTPEPYEVLWKVRNRGPEAAGTPGGLRGQIQLSGNVSRNVQDESTSYRGTHYVEAYIVREGVVVASDHHEVTIV
jgi:Second Messenger Oligonucleotide or Dinucleotide Synthetase domain/Adenylyl/Guanylyl and SMODS C-terminal sensor domain